MRALSLGEIVARLGGRVHGDAGVQVRRIATLDEAGPGDISFLSNPKYRDRLATTKASAVILAAPVEECSLAAVIAPDPYLYFARLAQWLNPVPAVNGGCHSSAVIEGKVDPTAYVAAQAFVAEGACVGPHCFIGPNCSVMEDVRIGAHTRLQAGVVVYQGCQIGERCLIHAGVVIGSDGFGFAREREGSWVKIPQTGRVRIGDDVEIGACTSIDRGALTDTVIGDGVKLDNQIQIAHNVTIGNHTAIAGCVGIAGSTHIGERCTIGGAAMIIGHLNISDDVHISSGTLIGKSISRPGHYTGTVPFMRHDEWLQNFARLRHLQTMERKVRNLEQRLTELEKK